MAGLIGMSVEAATRNYSNHGSPLTEMWLDAGYIAEHFLMHFLPPHSLSPYKVISSMLRTRGLKGQLV